MRAATRFTPAIAVATAGPCWRSLLVAWSPSTLRRPEPVARRARAGGQHQRPGPGREPPCGCCRPSASRPPSARSSSGRDGSFAVTDVPVGPFLLRGGTPRFLPRPACRSPCEANDSVTHRAAPGLDPAAGRGGAGRAGAAAGPGGAVRLAGRRRPGGCGRVLERRGRAVCPGRPVPRLLDGDGGGARVRDPAPRTGGRAQPPPGAAPAGRGPHPGWPGGGRRRRSGGAGPGSSSTGRPSPRPARPPATRKGSSCSRGWASDDSCCAPSSGQRISGHQVVVIDAETGWMPPAKVVVGPGATLSGRVVDDSGRPLARAEVEPVATPADDGPTSVKTDKEGRFTVGPLLPGRYQVWARLPGHAMTNPPEVQLRAESPTQLQLRLPRAVQVLGQTVDESGLPVAAAVVSVGRPQRRQPGSGGASRAAFPWPPMRPTFLPRRSTARASSARPPATPTVASCSPICRPVASGSRCPRPPGCRCVRARSRSSPAGPSISGEWSCTRGFPPWVGCSTSTASPCRERASRLGSSTGSAASRFAALAGEDGAFKVLPAPRSLHHERPCSPPCARGARRRCGGPRIDRPPISSSASSAPTPP